MSAPAPSPLATTRPVSPLPDEVRRIIRALVAAQRGDYRVMAACIDLERLAVRGEALAEQARMWRGEAADREQLRDLVYRARVELDLLGPAAAAVPCCGNAVWAVEQMRTVLGPADPRTGPVLEV